ncbi:transglutaminase family protein [Ralstonia pseudosolanacearum]
MSAIYSVNIIVSPFRTLDRIRLCAFVFVLAVAAMSSAQALEVIPAADVANIRRIQAILETSDEKIDLVRAKLAIDKMIDPSIDIEATVAKIDAIAAQNGQALPANASAWDKMQALRQFFYRAGPWNDNRPWHYDFDHPRGDNMADMLLPNYLETRKGQCVSMPLLFMFVAQKLGMEVALALAPNHTFVMLKNDNGAWLNLETTADGAPTRLETYQRQIPMSKRALDNGS